MHNTTSHQNTKKFNQIGYCSLNQPTQPPTQTQTLTHILTGFCRDMAEAHSHVPHTMTAVKGVGISTDKYKLNWTSLTHRNARYRRTMEDAHVIVDQFGGDPDQAYFAVYDGHGGRGAVDFTAEVLHQVNTLQTKTNIPESVGGIEQNTGRCTRSPETGLSPDRFSNWRE